MKIDMRSRKFVGRFEPAAEYICVNLHPPKLRPRYVEHLRSHYKADVIVYVLQELSTGMTALFLGLITNYLYDKYKRPRNKLRENDRRKKLAAKQGRTIKALERLLEKEEDKRIERVAAQSLAFHKEALMKVKDGDVSVELLVKDSIEALESKEVMRFPMKSTNIVMIGLGSSPDVGERDSALL